MVVKKYFITLLFAALAVGYNVLVDVLIGLPWYNFIINWDYSLTNPSERITAYVLLLFLVVPDLLHGIRRKWKPGSNGQGSAPTAGSDAAHNSGDESSNPTQSASGLSSPANPVNHGGNNRSGGQTNVK